MQYCSGMTSRVRDYGLVRSIAELQALADKLLADGLMVSFDVETSYSTPTPVPKRALNVTHPDQFVCGFSITNAVGWARYVPLLHDDYPGNLPVVEAWETIRPVLETLPVLAHQKKFEDKNLRMLPVKGHAHAPIRTQRGDDAMLVAYTLGRFKSVGLKELSKELLKYEQPEFSSLFGDAVLDKNGKVQKAKVEKQRFSQLNPSETHVLQYVCDDVSCELEIFDRLMAHLRDKEPKNRAFIYNVEMDISELMADVELYGVATDWEPMERHRALYKPFAARMEKSVKEGFAALVKDPEAREKIATMNLGSAPQLQKLLYEDIGWRATRFSRKTEKPSTDKIALEALSRKHVPVKRLLQFREMNNLGARHELWLDDYRDSYDQRVHPNFSQITVVSGRFAADKPAIQQLPKHWYWDVREPDETEADVRASSKNGERYWEGWFRKYIIAAPGNYLLTYDYSQVELRVLAGVSQEERLLQAFNDDEDVHTVTAAQMLRMRVEDVTEEHRQKGKTLNFALLYGMGIKSLADRLAMSIDEATAMYASYFEQFSSISTWVDRTKRQGRREKYVETFFGRRIPLWDMFSEKQGVRAKGERVAVNGPIQGGAADYMKIAMVRAYKMLVREGLWNNGVMITMNQHDSLTFEVSNDVDPNWLREKLAEAVVFTIKGFPKIKADWELGQTWGASAKWKDEQAVFEDGQWHVDGAVAVSDEDDDFYVAEDDGWGEDEQDAEVGDETVPEEEEEEAPVGVRTTVITCPEPPTQTQLQSLVALLRNSPGEQAVELVLGERSIPLKITTCLGRSDAGRISLAVGGAQVAEVERVQDIDVLASGLSL